MADLVEKLAAERKNFYNSIETLTLKEIKEKVSGAYNHLEESQVLRAAASRQG